MDRQRGLGHDAEANKAEREHWVRLGAALDSIARTEEWEVYRALLADKERESIQSLIDGGSFHHDYWVGYLEALRWTVAVPTLVRARLDNQQ